MIVRMEQTMFTTWPRVCVWWHDSHGPLAPGWVDGAEVEKVAEEGALRVYSCGFLIGAAPLADVPSITVCAHMHPERREVPIDDLSGYGLVGVLHIPTKAISALSVCRQSVDGGSYPVFVPLGRFQTYTMNDFRRFARDEKEGMFDAQAGS